MKYRVELTVSARDEIEGVFNWIAARAPVAADRWREGISAAIDALETMPMAHGMAPEGPFLSRPIRQTFFGKRGGRYRILFEVTRTSVIIIGVRHGSRRFMHEE